MKNLLTFMKSPGRIANTAGGLLFIVSLVMLTISVPMYVKSRIEPFGGQKECGNCHVKSKPVRGDSELLSIPRNHPLFIDLLGKNALAGGVVKKAIASNPSEPDVVMLKELADKYGPVKFSHKTHADMAQMSGSCWSCHHNNPVGKPNQTCKNCHKVKPDRDNPSMIRLKAAYHRHCIDCHKQWSHDNDCEVCHEKKGANKAKRHFPKLEAPHRIVYDTGYKKTVVTFFHNNHTKLFKIACENCHTGNSCADCHDRTNAAPATTRTSP